MSINRVIFSGNIGKDAELRSTVGGTAVLNFSVAINEHVKQQDGSYADRANWVDCVLFDRRAEALVRYLARGTKVAIDGRLRQNRWQDKATGANRSKLEVVVTEVEFLSPHGDGHQQQAPAAPAAAQPQASIYDESIPF